ncbi:hypothetical protein LguiB_013440 [Lonicera macranthoides]
MGNRLISAFTSAYSSAAAEDPSLLVGGSTVGNRLISAFASPYSSAAAEDPSLLVGGSTMGNRLISAFASPYSSAAAEDPSLLVGGSAMGNRLISAFASACSSAAAEDPLGGSTKGNRLMSDFASAHSSAAAADPSLLVGGSTMSYCSASASTSAADPSLLVGEYDVFLSFCGQDTRQHFTDHLYTSLNREGIRTFRDNDGLHVGEEIGPELLKAITDSKISIPIFSKNYAGSKWCLLELAQMVQCLENGGHKIFPIFYDVNPKDVRHQTGIYEAAFRQHKKRRYDQKAIQGWKDSLKKVGQLKGLELEKETAGSLITIGDDGILRMHDQLRALGRQIVREGKLDKWGRWSRLWDSDKAFEVYKTGQVKALCLGRIMSPGLLQLSHLRRFLFRVVEHCPRYLEGEKFLRLPHLRSLALDALDTLYGDFEHCFPNLRWLQWRYQAHLLDSTTLTNLHLRNLVILDLSCSYITEDWNLWNQIQMFNKLKVLDLSDCKYLKRIPFLSTLSNLERLVVNYCTKLYNLDGIEELESLRYLDATCCYSLETLPNLSRLTKLKELKVMSCALITDIPGLDKLESLEFLCLRLKRLDITYCPKLIEIHALEGLESLGCLVMHNCKSIETLPELSKLKSLKALSVKNCEKLTEISGLKELRSLEYLDIGRCKLIESLPDFSNLRKLEVINATGCEILTDIWGLENLESFGDLFIGGCKSLNTLIYSNVSRIRIHTDFHNDYYGMSELYISFNVFYVQVISSMIAF